MPALKDLYDMPLYHNSIALMLNTGISTFFNLVFWLIAGRTTSAGDVGMATAAISAAALIVTLSRLGMDAGLMRYFPSSRNKSSFYNATLLITLLVTIVVSAIFYGGLDAISPALGFLMRWPISLVFIGYILLTAVCNMMGTALVAIRKAHLSLLQGSVLTLRIPLLFFVAPLGTLGIIAALNIAYVVMLAVGVIMLYRLGISNDLSISLGEVRKSLRFSLGNYIATIMAAAPIALVPIMIINTIGAKQGAYFFIAYSVAAFLFMVPDSISTSLFVEGSHGQPLYASARRSIGFAILILAPVALALIIFGDRILLIFSHECSTEAFQTLRLLALSSLFAAITSIFITVKKVQKDMAMVNYLSLALSILTIGLGYLLLISFGLVGLGYSWLISNVAVCAYAGWVMLREKWIQKE